MSARPDAFHVKQEPAREISRAGPYWGPEVTMGTEKFVVWMLTAACIDWVERDALGAEMDSRFGYVPPRSERQERQEIAVHEFLSSVSDPQDLYGPGSTEMLVELATAPLS